MRGGRLVAALLGLALAAGAWWVFRPLDANVGGDDTVAEETAASDASMEGLAGHRTAKPVAAPKAVALHGTVLAEVRRAGQPAAAHLSVFETARLEIGQAPNWGVRTPTNGVPTEDAAKQAPVSGAEAGADGKATLDLPAPAIYRIVATAPDGTRAQQTATLATGGMRVSVSLDLRGGTDSLAGRAVYSDGRPFHGFVSADAAGQGDQDAASVRPFATAEDGTFTVTGLEPGPYAVSAFVPGQWRAYGRTITIPYHGEYVLTVDGGTREVAGRVVADKDGQGVSGATVLVSVWGPPGLASFQARAVSDADGRFKIRAASHNAWWQAYAVGFATMSTNRSLPPEGEVLELRLVKAGRIAGRVTSEGDGQPVAGISVYAETNGDPMGHPAHATSGADGRYELIDVRPGEVTVLAVGQGWYTKGLEGADPNGFNPLGLTLAPEAAVALDLVVTRAAQAQGRVLDAKGEPVGGARVTAARLLPGRRNVNAFHWLAEAQGVATAADGSFVLDSLVPDFSYQFEATAPGASPAKAGPVRSEAGKPIQVELHLGAPRWADITCMEKGGGPVAGVTVYAYTQDPVRGWQSHGQVPSGSGGLAHLGPLPAGPIQIYAWGEGYQADENKTVGGPDGATEDIRDTFTLRRSYAISGIVKYADGSPGANLVLEVQGGNMTMNGGIGDDGMFRFEGFEEGTAEIRVLKEWGGPVLATARGKTGEDVTITVPGTKPARFTVRVVDPEGKPVPDATVVLQVEGNTTGSNLSDGKAELDVPKTESWILVHSAQTHGGAPLPYGLTIAGPVPPEPKEFEVKLVPELRIEGVVTASDGRPVRGVLVGAVPFDLPKPFDAWGERVSSARTDDQGRFRIGRLGAGGYRLTVSASEHYGSTEPKEAKAGDKGVSIVLGEGLDASPVILDPEGKPVAGATVRANPVGNGRQAIAESDSNGVARLHGLTPKTAYALNVAPPDDRDDVLALGVGTWTPNDDALHLPPGLFVAGVVRDSAGRPVPSAAVERLGKANVEQTTVAKSDGSFRMTRVPVGEVRLVARRSDPSAVSKPVVTSAGSKDVVLVVDPTASLSFKIEDWKPVADGWWFNLTDEDTRVATEWAQVDADGKAVLNGLHPDATYTLFLVREPENEEPMVAWKSGIKGSAGQVTAKLEAGLVVSGRLLAPPGIEGVDVMASDGIVSRQAGTDETGRFLMKGLHAGSWTFTATASMDGTSYRAEARADAGGRVELDLKPVR